MYIAGSGVRRILAIVPTYGVCLLAGLILANAHSLLLEQDSFALVAPPPSFAVMSTFLLLRYVAFALFISFSSAICIVAAYNLGLSSPKTPDPLPEVDIYFIFLGSFGLVIVFPVIFVEMLRKNAFIARVMVEMSWVALLWIMHLSGAAVITAIASQLTCSTNGPQKPVYCTSAKVLVAFAWLCTLILLSYFFGLVISAAHHYNKDSRVWWSGVRDYPWFIESPKTPVAKSFASYGRITEPKNTQNPGLPSAYAQQIGLSGSYAVEPLTFETEVGRPVPPPEIVRPIPLPAPEMAWTVSSSTPEVVPASAVFFPTPPAKRDSDTRRLAAPPPAALASAFSTPTPSTVLSFYPQHLQGAVGALPQFPDRASRSSPPPAGSWPRSNPQEPLPRRQKQRSLPMTPASASSPQPEMVQPEGQVTESGAARSSRPSGPRTATASSLPKRSRPPPLDLSWATLHPEGPRR